MVYRAISKDFKERALWLWENGYMTDEVCDVLGVSQASLYRWQQNVARYGNVVPPPNPLRPRGPPSHLSARHHDDLFMLSNNYPELYLDEIVDWLYVTREVVISRTIIHDLIADAGLTYKIMRRAASERDEVVRAAFRLRMENDFVASQIVAVDETSKDDRTIFRKRGRGPRGQRLETSADFVRGQRYSIVAALSTEGYIAADVVQGSVTGSKFFDFIVERVLPNMNRFPQDNSVLLLDNCAIHKSHHLRQIVEAHGCILLFLPPYSPDFNPIEESFSCLKAWIRRHWKTLYQSETPELDLLEACGTITGDKARGWFRNSGFVDAPEE